MGRLPAPHHHLRVAVLLLLLLLLVLLLVLLLPALMPLPLLLLFQLLPQHRSAVTSQQPTCQAAQHHNPHSRSCHQLQQAMQRHSHRTQLAAVSKHDLTSALNLKGR